MSCAVTHFAPIGTYFAPPSDFWNYSRSPDWTSARTTSAWLRSGRANVLLSECFLLFLFKLRKSSFLKIKFLKPRKIKSYQELRKIKFPKTAGKNRRK